MKYFLSLLLFCITLWLTGCFEKKTENEVLSPEEAQTQLQELAPQSGETQEPWAENPTPLPQNENTSWEEVKNTTQAPSSLSSDEGVLSSPETLQEQQEIIEDAEEDLEALFRDIIPSE